MNDEEQAYLAAEGAAAEAEAQAQQAQDEAEAEATKFVQPRKKVMDDREPGNIRMKLFEVGWEQGHLYTGDYWFFTHNYKKVGITRKSIDDLLGSLSGAKSPDGKRRYPFPKQLEEMLDEYNILIIILEGSWSKVRPSEKLISSRGIEYHTWSMVWNFLRRWWDKGFTPELTINEGHTIQRLNELYALYQKPYSLSSASRDYTDDRVLAFPSGCRGKTAMDCLAQFGSLTTVGLASVEDLQQVEKVGGKKAALIHNHFNKATEGWQTIEGEKGKKKIEQGKFDFETGVVKW